MAQQHHYLIRVGRTTNRVTNGKQYALDDDDYIIDDNGTLMQASVSSDAHWKRVTKVSNSFIESQSKEKSMAQTLCIRNVTLVNGKELTTFDSDELIQMIESEQTKLKRLVAFNQTLSANSPAVVKLAEKHSENIEVLLDALNVLI